MTPPYRTISLSQHIVRRAGATIALTLLLAVAGCISLSSEDANQPAEQAASPTPALTPTGQEASGSIEASVVSITQAGNPDNVLGSAVVLTDDGLLLTSSDTVQGDIEVSLPGNGEHRPALVSTEPETGLALLTMPADGLSPVEFSSDPPSEQSDVFASGFDGSSGTSGRMGGEVTGIAEPPENVDYNVQGPWLFETNINLLTGFVGGALSDDEGGFIGLLVPDVDEDGNQVVRAISHWFVEGWLESRQGRLDALLDDSEGWEAIRLPGDWSIRQPDGWSIAVSVDSDDAFRAELIPGDPDVSLQLAYSVEQNDHGTDAAEFISNVFEDRSSARLWSVDVRHDEPFVRATILQEGALVDVAYILDEEYLIAVSMTSGYHPESDQAQVDEARALFDAVIEGIENPHS